MNRFRFTFSFKLFIFNLSLSSNDIFFFRVQKPIATCSKLFPKVKHQPFFISNRSMFIQTQDTPNPNSIKFLPGVQVSSEHI